MVSIDSNLRIAGQPIRRPGEHRLHSGRRRYGGARHARHSLATELVRRQSACGNQEVLRAICKFDEFSER